jgi:voltage-gated potassium channel
VNKLVRSLRLFLVIMVIVTILAAAGFMIVENKSLGETVYFALVTITTVGYGDITPQTGWGRLLVIIMILGGVGTFTAVVANATEALLSRRDKLIRLEKMNMVIGVFFSQIGTPLLADLSDIDRNREKVRQALGGGDVSEEEHYDRARRRLKDYLFRPDITRADLPAMKALLDGNLTQMMRLLENPILLEHDQFTNLLMAVFHLREELIMRSPLDRLTEDDLIHLAGDIARVYNGLLEQWLDYMVYLKRSYPFLFALAVKRNPFQEGSWARLTESRD